MRKFKIQKFLHQQQNNFLYVRIVEFEISTDKLDHPLFLNFNNELPGKGQRPAPAHNIGPNSKNLPERVVSPNKNRTIRAIHTWLGQRANRNSSGFGHIRTGAPEGGGRARPSDTNKSNR
jgi:hypothetical protein